MQDILRTKLHDYILHNNPDLLLTLQQEGKVNSYLREKITTVDAFLDQLQAEGKPAYIIEEACMGALTRELRPSRFNCLCSLLEEEFEADYRRLQESGILTYEVLNLMAACAHGFDAIGFTKDRETDQQLRYVLAGMIQEYLENEQ
ncbi:hypothetical protein GCM10023188_15750 [Pontibacter saemangeumensis]|uniref:Uncharacterized protein n=1 Tax=Pontibacter saemangeumensis TaxID=1084525 RepID=A0ABP8LKE7_9BACT